MGSDGKGTTEVVGGGRGPLDGLLVVDLSRVLSGPYAAMMLGDLGARVVKIEHPETGDDTRAWGPPFVGEDETKVSTYFLSVNRNKESITLDLKDPSDRAMLLQLVERADILVENFRPGVLDRLQLAHALLHEHNPRLVILSITGFGHDGPQATRPGYDQIVQGESGLMSLTGPGPTQPLKVGIPISDLLTGIFGVTGVLAALHEREHSGRGDVVHASLLASSIAVQSFQAARWLIAGELPLAQGNQHPTVAPYGMFTCRGEQFQLAIGNDAIWRRFAPIIGLDPDDSRFCDNERRVANREELVTEIEARLSERPVDKWLALFDQHGIPAGRVKTLDQVYADPQVKSQGLLLEIAHPTHGTLRLPGPPIRFDHTEPVTHLAPPRLGEHNEEFRRWLTDIEALSTVQVLSS